MASAANDTPTAIDLLKADNDRLNGVVTALTVDRDKHKADVTTLTKERDELQVKVGNPDEHRKRADQLQGELRLVNHRVAFSEVAEAAGVDRSMISDLFQLSGYKAEKDDVDPAAFETIIAEAKEKRPRFFADAAQAAGTQQQEQPAATEQNGQKYRPVPAGGRGAAHDPSKSGVTVRGSQLRDPKFKLNPKNKEIIAEAVKAGRVDWNS